MTGDKILKFKIVVSFGYVSFINERGGLALTND